MLSVNKMLETLPKAPDIYFLAQKKKKPELYAKIQSQFQILTGCRAQRPDP